jgi:hypothetical protein
MMWNCALRWWICCSELLRRCAPSNTPHPPFGHLLPQGEKGERGIGLGADRLRLCLAALSAQGFPSPLVGEGGLARSAKTDEGCSSLTMRWVVLGRCAPFSTLLAQLSLFIPRTLQIASRFISQPGWDSRLRPLVETAGRRYILPIIVVSLF